MNRWYLGYIEGLPVDVFLADDYSMDYYLDDPLDGSGYPQSVIDACERIRAAKMRSLAGCKRVLAENGWSNS